MSSTAQAYQSAGTTGGHRPLASVQRQIEAKTAALQQELSRLGAQHAQVSKELLDLKQTMPLLTRFVSRNGFLSGPYSDLEYMNTSRDVVSLRFKITRANGSVRESTFKATPGEWTKLQVEGYSEFHADDTVLITSVDEDKGRFRALFERCPPDKAK